MESFGKLQMKVGSFMVIGLAFIMLTIFTLGGSRGLFSNQVQMFVVFDQVQGLAKGSVVSLSGIVVGNIDDIGFTDDSKGLKVTINIDNKFAPRIVEGTMAEIRTQGALGDKFIFIIPGPIGGKPMAAGSKIETAKASDLIGIFSERGKETEKVFDILGNLYQVTKTLTEGGRFEKIVNNLASASTHLNETAANTKNITAAIGNEKSLEQIKTTISRFDRIAEKIDKGEGTLGALINDSSLHDQLRNMLGGATKKNQIRSVIRTTIDEEKAK